MNAATAMAVDRCKAERRAAKALEARRKELEEALRNPEVDLEEFVRQTPQE